ncbi:MAG: hypothetical protein ACLQU5_23845 [Isosphaeraceae bacterium]
MLVRISREMARFGLPGVILGVAISWMAGARGPLAEAQTRPGGEGGPQVSLPLRGPDAGRAQQGQGRLLAGGESNGTLAMVATPAGPAQWLYLIDTKSHAFAIYRLDPSNPKGSLKLEAARQYQWDLKLEHYNNQAPEPAAIESMVRTLAQPMTR